MNFFQIICPVTCTFTIPGKSSINNSFNCGLIIENDILEFQKATITLLLQSGADATVCSPTGETALSFAACQGQLDAVEQLLEYGADPDIANVVCITFV